MHSKIGKSIKRLGGFVTLLAVSATSVVTPAVPDCTAERFWLLTEPSVSSSVVVCAVSLSVPLDVLLFCVHPVQAIIAATAMLIAQANIFFCMRLTLLFVFGTP